MKKKPKFIIELKLNPIDDWKKYKQFYNEKKAKQSLKMLIKHIPNIFKESNYYKYRLITIKNCK